MSDAILYDGMRVNFLVMRRSCMLGFSGSRIPAYGRGRVPGGEGMNLAVGWDPRAAGAAIDENWD